MRRAEKNKADAALLASWQQLQVELPGLSEETVKHLLELEVHGRCRVGFITRLHGRFTVLRQQRERTTMLSGVWPKNLNECEQE